MILKKKRLRNDICDYRNAYMICEEIRNYEYVQKITRSQNIYQYFLDSEYPGTFAEYLGIKKGGLGI